MLSAVPPCSTPVCTVVWATSKPRSYGPWSRCRRSRRHRDQGPYDRGFDVAHTTVHTGVLHGGTALNIVPHECSFDFEFRHLPADDPERLYAEFDDYVKKTLE